MPYYALFILGFFFKERYSANHCPVYYKNIGRHSALGALPLLELLERQYVNAEEGDFHMPVKESKELMNAQCFTTMAKESQLQADVELCFHVSPLQTYELARPSWSD